MGQLEQEKDAGYLFLDIDSKRQKKTDNYEKKKKKKSSIHIATFPPTLGL